MITTGLGLTHNTNVREQQTFNKAPDITGHLAVFGKGQAAEMCATEQQGTVLHIQLDTDSSKARVWVG